MTLTCTGSGQWTTLNYNNMMWSLKVEKPWFFFPIEKKWQKNTTKLSSKKCLRWYLQIGQTFWPGNEPDNAIPLRPSQVRTIGCKRYSPSFMPRLLVKGSNRHQEFTNELRLTCKNKNGGGLISWTFVFSAQRSGIPIIKMPSFCTVNVQTC